MIKTVLISSEENILQILESVNENVNINLSYSACVMQEDAADTAARFEETGAELCLVCGLALPKAFCEKSKMSFVSIGYSIMDFAWLNSALSGKEAAAIIVPKYMLDFVDEVAIEAAESVQIYAISGSAEAESAVVRAKENGAKIIAGLSFVAEAAEKHDLQYVRFAPGGESVRYALDAAQREAKRIVLERRRKAQERALVYSNFGGVIKVDADGRILEISEVAKQLLGCRDKYVIGSYVLNVFNQLDKELLDAVLVDREHIFKHLTGPRNKRYMVNIEPALDGDELFEVYISFQKVEKSADTAVEESGSNNKAAGRFSQYVYTSEVFGNLLKKAKFASYTDAPVLLHGEDGTETIGFAKSIHNESGRYKNNFVEIECDAWDSDKMREILFGVGNSDGVKGAVEAAEGGTLFLNHIDKLSPELQYLVLQVVKGQYSFETGMYGKQSNVRIVAATDKDLRKMVTDGEFRRDLYYALNVISLEFPSIRERKEDIRYIVDLFLEYYGEKYSKPVMMADAGYDCLLEYNWPGNTRQLEYFCQKLLLTAPSRRISEAYVRNVLMELSRSMREEAEETPKKENLNEEARSIIAALQKNRGSKTKTAEALGISKATLWRRMQKYGITDYS